MKILHKFILLTLTSLSFTIKCQVTQAWDVNFNGAANGDDKAIKVAKDNNNNIYVTGSSWNGSNYDFVTIKYNSSGVMQWFQRFDNGGNDYATDMVLDRLDIWGNVIVTGISNAHISTIKYNNNGLHQWTRINPTISYYQYAYVTIDGAQNVYVTGGEVDPTCVCYPNPFDTWARIVVIQYDQNGSQQWVTRYDPGNVEHSLPTGGIVFGGTVFVCGLALYVDNCQPPTLISNFVTLKLNQNGTIAWTRFYNGPVSGIDASIATSMTILEPNDWVWVTGKSRGNNSGYDIATVQYDAFGNLGWVQRFNGDANMDDVPSKIVRDPLYNVILTGYSYKQGTTPGTPSTTKDYVTIKYNSNGIHQWTSFYDGNFNSDDVAKDVAFDGVYPYNIYVTGYSYGNNSGGDGDAWFTDYATLRYNGSNGAQAWVMRYDGEELQDDEGNSLTVVGTTNATAYVTGQSTRTNGYSPGTLDYLTIKYTQSGDRENGGLMTSKTVLYQNNPNPFNPSTVISFELAKKQSVKLLIYNMLGQTLTVLVDGELEAGTHQYSWNGENNSSGMYFYKIITNDYTETKRMILIK